MFCTNALKLELHETMKTRCRKCLTVLRELVQFKRLSARLNKQVAGPVA